MFFLLSKAVLSCFLSLLGWQQNFETATKMAAEKHQLILLNFSGSDWCGPCIRMHKEIFSDASFVKMADSTLVMYNADFPRNKKNMLPAVQKKQNEILADKYNPEGNFPLTLLINNEGAVVKKWIGLPASSPQEFTESVKSFCNQYADKSHD